jgi:hypothetical protein
MHCPKCGRALDSVREFRKHWSELLKCGTCRDAFMNFQDMRNIYPPLIPLLDRRAESMLFKASESEVDAAFSEVRVVDHQTVSIVKFEAALVALFYSH